MTPESKTFRELCASRLGIPAEAFEEAVLMECLPPKHRFIGRLRWRFNRSYFFSDLELIRTVADCATMSEVTSEVTDFFGHHEVVGFQRRLLHARLSGQRLVNLAGKLLPRD